MQSNLSSLDQSIRFTLAIIGLAVYSIEIVDTTANWLFVIMAFMLLFSAVIRYCPLYAFWDFSTNEKKEID